MLLSRNLASIVLYVHFTKGKIDITTATTTVKSPLNPHSDRLGPRAGGKGDQDNLAVGRAACNKQRFAAVDSLVETVVSGEKNSAYRTSLLGMYAIVIFSASFENPKPTE